MDKAVERVVEAISRKEKILLYGDYDVDGTTCVALMYSFLKDVGVAEYVDYYIPDRYKEGYGISYKGIDFAKENGHTLMIAMDCGITAVDKVARANEYGLDVIICDHHLPGSVLPKGIAVLDPKRSDCEYPYKELSGCGVSFKLCQGITEVMDLEEDIWMRLLDLLVISTGCDIVEIRGENRILAHYGLKRINEGKARTGIKALIGISKKELPFSVTDIVFGLGPVINAAGRISDAKDAVRLLLEEDGTEALAQAELLMEMNLERRKFEKGITEEAINLHESNPMRKEQKSIVLHQEHWHKGVVGIAASKMVDKFHRPTILLTGNKDMAVGSARSVRGFDIHFAIHECRHLLHNFGGHKYAAGLSIPKKNLPAFKELFEKVVSERITAEQLIPEIPVSAELHLNDVNPKFWNLLKQFSPFGPGNRRPIFHSKGVRDSGYSKV
ncbi:MAG: single-stranded-DNA-specific exonuclease RecJ, partial [Saprospiraceae bacterium]